MKSHVESSALGGARVSRGSQLPSRFLPTVGFRYRTLFWRTGTHRHGSHPQAIPNQGRGYLNAQRSRP